MWHFSMFSVVFTSKLNTVCCKYLFYTIQRLSPTFDMRHGYMMHYFLYWHIVITSNKLCSELQIIFDVNLGITSHFKHNHNNLLLLRVLQFLLHIILNEVFSVLI